MGVRIRRWHVSAGVAAALVLVAGAVFGWPGGSDEPPPPTAKPAQPKPILKPLRVAPSPLWTSEGVALESTPTGIDMFGGIMVIHQGGQQATAWITGVDMATRTVRYTLTVGNDLTGRGGEWAGSAQDVLVNDSGLIMPWRYHAVDCDIDGCTTSEADQDGLALVSGTDGRTVWETTIIPSYEELDFDKRPKIYVEVVTDDVVLVTIGAGGPSEDRHQTPPLRTLALDARTGATLWESQDPMWPHAAAGDTVVGMAVVPGSSKWTAVGADLRTGKRTWTRPGGLDESTVEQVAGDVALLRGRTGAASQPERLVFVDTASGRTITELDHPENFIELHISENYDQFESSTSCDGDGHTLIVCVDKSIQDNLVAIFRVDKRTVTTEAVDYHDLQLMDAWYGRAELSGTPQDDFAPQLFTMDSAGNVIDKDLRLPGDIQELTADKATFVTGGGVEVYEVLES